MSTAQAFAALGECEYGIHGVEWATCYARCDGCGEPLDVEDLSDVVDRHGSLTMTITCHSDECGDSARVEVSNESGRWVAEDCE